MELRNNQVAIVYATPRHVGPQVDVRGYAVTAAEWVLVIERTGGQVLALIEGAEKVDMRWT